MAWKNGPGRLSNNNWKKLRAYALERDKHTCYVCSGSANQVDHIIPFYLGGTNHPMNLAAVCMSCHKKKTSKEASHARYGTAQVKRKDTEHPMSKVKGWGGTP